MERSDASHGRPRRNATRGGLKPWFAFMPPGARTPGGHRAAAILCRGNRIGAWDFAADMEEFYDAEKPCHRDDVSQSARAIAFALYLCACGAQGGAAQRISVSLALAN